MSKKYTANNFIVSGGISSQFLKADGSLDNNIYQTELTNPITGIGSNINSTTYALQDGTILYHSIKRFIPSGEISTSGTIVTTIGSQFDSGMVGAKLTINGEWRIITGITSSTIATVASAYSTNYTGVIADNWGVYSKYLEILNNGDEYEYTYTGNQSKWMHNGGSIFYYADFGQGIDSWRLRTDGLWNGNNSNISWGSSGSLSTRDSGIRRNSDGILEIYNGVTADGTLTNRRDLLVRNISAEAGTNVNHVVIKSQLDTKQDNLVSGTNIKTLNGNSLLGSGNLTIDNGVPYTGATSDVDLNSKNLTTTGILSAQVLKIDGGGVSFPTNTAGLGSYPTFFKSSTGFGFFEPTGNKQAVFSLSSLSSTPRTFTFPNATGTLALTSDLSSKQDVLVSGTNIKTINGNSLLGSGDLVIAGGGGATNLSYTASAINGIINSDTGTDATIPLGNGTNAGLSLNDYTTTEKSKLSNIADGATLNSPDATLLNRANHTGTQLASTISDFNSTTNGLISTAITGKLDSNVAITGATNTKITYDSKGLVTSGTNATTADINPSTNRNYVTDAESIIISNTTGTNSGDSAVNTTSNAYADAKITQVITNGVTTTSPSEDAVYDALSLKINKNTLQLAETTPVNLFKITPFTSGNENFELDFNSVPNSGAGAGTYNHGAWMGYNVGHHSTNPVTANKPSIMIGLEDNYFDHIGDLQFGTEFYVQGFSPDSTTIQFSRPYYARGAQKNDGTDWWTVISNIGSSGSNRSFTVREGVNNLFQITPTGAEFYTAETRINNILKVQSGNILMDNNRYFQIKNSSAGVASVMNVAADNTFYIGDIFNNLGGNVILRSGGLSAMTLYNNGNVGIGTTSTPSDLFTINKSSDPNVRFVNSTYSAAQTSTFWLGNNDATWKNYSPYMRSIQGAGINDYYLAFGLNNAERFRIGNSGNILIGTTTDSSDKLQVNGSLLATSIKKSGGLSTEYLMADGSVSTGSTGTTNLSYTVSPTNGIVNSDTGTDATIPLADGTNAGLLKPADFTTLSNGVVGLTGNQTVGGTKEFTSVLNAIGVNIDNGGSNTGLTILNNLASTGISVSSDDTGKGIVINNTTSATGTPFTIQKNNVDKLTIDDAGNVTGNSFVKTGGTSSQILTGNGTVLTAGTGITISGGTISSTSAPSPDARLITDVLTADQSNSTTTLTKVTGLDQTLGVGIYQFRYMVRYQSSVTTTGVRFSVNFSGTTVFFLARISWSDVSATASTATPDQDQVIAAGSVTGGFAARAKSTTGWGTTLGVDTIDADMMMIIEGTFECSTSGDIQLYHGSETAAATTVKAGSNLVITKVN